MIFLLGACCLNYFAKQLALMLLVFYQVCWCWSFQHWLCTLRHSQSAFCCFAFSWLSVKYLHIFSDRWHLLLLYNTSYWSQHYLSVFVLYAQYDFLSQWGLGYSIHKCVWMTANLRLSSLTKGKMLNHPVPQWLLTMNVTISEMLLDTAFSSP